MSCEADLCGLKERRHFRDTILCINTMLAWPSYAFLISVHPSREAQKI